jgi:hypothetical protein
MRRIISYGLVALSLLLVSSFCFSSSLETEATAVDPAFNMAVAETHWAFVPLGKPAIPTIDSGPGNEVDAFILQKLQERGLKPNPLTDKRSLIRRVTYDLTGLPPTYEEVQSFVADESPDAYETLVDRLLASSAYGERWGRHWLDVARYADSEGRPNFRKGNRYVYAHTYRDYVIESFNEGKLFDRFILEQIAADQLDLGGDNKKLAALGFLTLGNSFFRRKDFIIDDQIDVITRGLQGLTVSCARCHDHKFDPIPTKDYYSLHGIFNSSELPEELPIIQYPENDADYEAYLAELAENQERVNIRSEGVIDEYLFKQTSVAGTFLGAIEEGKTIESEDDFKVFSGTNRVGRELLRRWIDYVETEEARSHPVLKDWFEKYAESDREAGINHYNQIFSDALSIELEGFESVRAFLTEPGTPLNPDRSDVAVWIDGEIRAETNSITKGIETIEWTHSGTPFRAHSLVDVLEPKDSPIYKRGDPKNLGDEVPRQFLEILSGDGRQPYTVGSGRLGLARDITNPNNPLTARVFVNRVWGWRMGTPLVDTPSDFGVRTPEPVHVDLLNWLAASFIESGWSIKALHKMIVFSNTYQQSSSPDPDSLVADSENSLWHHFPKARLDFESMRDTLLSVSGNLDPTMGGVQQDILDPTSNRRTVYSYYDRTEPAGIFQTFDHPSSNASAPARFETIVPQQALFLMNSPFIIRQAKFLADRIEKKAGDDTESRIGEYYRAVFQREATENELRAAIEFIDVLEAFAVSEAAEVSTVSEAEEPLTGWELYAQTLLLSNEFMFVD